jgi:1-acyl-sn-glycerol-3-phosphate acyltransferase
MSKTPLFIKIARPTYGKWLNWYHRVKTAGYGQLPESGPYLILANHTHSYDPFFISSSLKVHVRWVAGAYLFKNQLIKLLLGRWVGGIAKQQGRSDLQTIRDISSAFKQNEIVGLFPEGTRTWDGEPLGFDVATAKLVRIFNVPVVLMHIEGGYAQRPRWAKYSRKGEITLRVVRVVYPDELRRMKVGELHDLLTNTLGFSHRRWQAEHRIPYVSDHLSEGLEKVLYLCPSCGGKSTITTEGDRIVCTNCSLKGKLNPYDELEPVSADFPALDSIHAWHEWEQSELVGIARETAGGTPLFPADEGVLLQKGEGKRLVTWSKRFTLTLESDRMVATGKFAGAGTLVFAFKDIQSMIVNAKSTVEFYHGDTLWRIRVVGTRSILKYVELYGSLKAMGNYEEDQKEVPAT